MRVLHMYMMAEESLELNVIFILEFHRNDKGI
jgi:hypothetical protein